MGGLDGGGAAAERIQDYIAFVAGRGDYALQECAGFLSVVSQVFVARYRTNIPYHVLNGVSRGNFQVSLESRGRAAHRPVDEPGVIKNVKALLHSHAVVSFGTLEPRGQTPARNGPVPAYVRGVNTGAMDVQNLPVAFPRL